MRLNARVVMPQSYHLRNKTYKKANKKFKSRFKYGNYHSKSKQKIEAIEKNKRFFGLY